MGKKLSKNQLRSIGRSYALQALYQNELNPQSSDFVWESELDDEVAAFALSPIEQETALDFARSLYEGVADRRGEIDHALNAAFNKGRTLELTAPVDRCILRLAAFEILFTETPRAVVISQALELGNKFGDVKTTSFLNGVLDQIGQNSDFSSVPKNNSSANA